jgi:alpha-tubulin suppressor-like RCC1 family protein
MGSGRRSIGALLCAAMLAAGFAVTTPSPAAAAPAPVTALAVGGEHACGVTIAGTVTCWGNNSFGQTGRPVTLEQGALSVPGLSGVTAIAAGSFSTCALLKNQTVKCWGDNRYGQLGDGTTTARSTPVTVPGLTGVTAIAATKQIFGSRFEEHTCALLGNGTAKCWGDNSLGQIGDGTQTDRPTATAVSGLTGATAITVGYRRSCARLSNGTVKCWGTDSFTGLALTPVTVANLTDVVDVRLGDLHACARLTNATVKCWGNNNFGQIGDGTQFTSRPSPTPVSGVSGAVAIAMGSMHSCAVLSNGTAKCWGVNSLGEIGEGTVNPTRPTPTTVTGLTTVRGLGAGSRHSCALREVGTVRCWGVNDLTQLGDPSVVPLYSATPVTVVGVNLARVSYTTGYTAQEQARMLQSAAYLETTPEELQRMGVGLFVFLLALSNPRPEPSTPTPPVVTGPVSYTTTWTAADIDALQEVQAQYSLTPQQAQKYGVQLINFLLALGGN